MKGTVLTVYVCGNFPPSTALKRGLFALPTPPPIA